MKKIDKYINTAKKYDLEKTPFSIEEVRTMIENGGESENRINYKSSKGAIKMTAFSAGALALLFGGYMFFAPNNQLNDNNIVINKINNESFLLASGEEPQNSEISNPKSNQVNKISIDSLDDFDEIINRVPKQEESISSMVKSANTCYMPIICLNQKDLAEIGLDANDSAFSYTRYFDLSAISFDESSSIRKYQLNGYTDTSTKVPKTVIFNGTGYKIGKLIPAGQKVNFTEIMPNFLESESCSMPIFDTDKELDAKISNMIQDETHEISKSIINLLLNENIDEASLRNARLEIDKTIFPLGSQMVPLVLRLSKSEFKSNIVLWYIPSESFIKKLPKNCQETIKKSIGLRSTIDCADIDPKEHNRILRDYIKKYQKNDRLDQKMNSMKEELLNADKQHARAILDLRKLELNDNELKNIGIEKENGIYTFPIESRVIISRHMKNEVKQRIANRGYDTSKSEIIIRSKFMIDSTNSDSKQINYTGWNQESGDISLPFGFSQNSVRFQKNQNGDYEKRGIGFENAVSDSPVLDKLSQNSKDYESLFTQDKESYLTKPKISRIIPVYLSLGHREDEDSNKIKYSDVFIWYYASNEFIAKLPDRYRIPLEKEMAVADDIENGKIEQHNACEALKGEPSYFGLCQLSGGNIENAAIFPNPTNSIFKIKFKLRSGAKVSVQVYNSTGDYVANLINGQEFKAGLNEKEINSGLQNGVYVLIIQDDKGGKSTSKITIMN